MSNWTGRGFLVPRFGALHVGVFDETRKRRPRRGISDRCSVNSCLFEANKNSRHVGVSTSRDKSPRRNYALIRCSRTAVFLVVRNDERERVRAVRASIEWRGRMKQRGKERKKKRKKDLKRKSQSGVQWYEAQREVTSEVVRGDCSRNPSDGRDHACLHARDNDAARRRLFLYSRSSLFLARPFFVPFFLYFFLRPFFPFPYFFSTFHPDSITTPGARFHAALCSKPCNERPNG